MVSTHKNSKKQLLSVVLLTKLCLSHGHTAFCILQYWLFGCHLTHSYMWLLRLMYVQHVKKSLTNHHNSPISILRTPKFVVEVENTIEFSSYIDIHSYSTKEHFSITWHILPRTCYLFCSEGVCTSLCLHIIEESGNINIIARLGT